MVIPLCGLITTPETTYSAFGQLSHTQELDGVSSSILGDPSWVLASVMLTLGADIQEARGQVTLPEVAVAELAVNEILILSVKATEDERSHTHCKPITHGQVVVRNGELKGGRYARLRIGRSALFYVEECRRHVI